MSAGSFEYSKYESNAGNVYRIRVQPETLALDIGGNTNTPPAGDIDSEGTVKVSGGKRSFGVIPRSVSLAFTGALPDGYSGDNVRVPILTQATYDAISSSATGTYLGVGVEVVGKSPEQVR